MLAVLVSGSVVSDMGTIMVTGILPITHQGIPIIVSLLLRIVITIDLITAIIEIHTIAVMVRGIVVMHIIPNKDITQVVINHMAAHRIIIVVITTNQGMVETG